MFFNGGKFKHLHYGSHPGNSCVYLAQDGSGIETCSSVRDLGVIMESSAKFTEQIRTVKKKGKDTVGWMLRVFSTRDPLPMMTLYKSLVVPVLEYCCLLWSPRTLGLIRDLESVQRSFTYRINGMRGFRYWDRLKRLNLYSLERRRDCYYILYVWKILNGSVPNISEDQYRIREFHHVRRGRLCVVPSLNRQAPAYVQTLREHSIAVYGPRLFNALPKELRNHGGELHSFKSRLDVFLAGVPDKPALPHYLQSAAGNSLLQQLAQVRAEQV